MGTTTNPAGMLQPSTLWGVYNNLRFVIAQALSLVQTSTIVKVIACSNDGDVSPVGTVDVQILVNQVNGQMVGTPHLTMYGLPYLRIQGGANAIIMDPQPGDIGIAIFASRDITKVKATKAEANPGSFRTHDFADGMYLGGLLNAAPSQYVQFTSSGINVVSSNEVKITAPKATVNASDSVTITAPSIKLGDGSTETALMTENFLLFWTTNILPFLQSKGYGGPPAPLNSITTVVQGQ